MNIEEYKTKLAKIKSDFDDAGLDLMKRYALEHKNYSIGDIVKNDLISIIITEYEIGVEHVNKGVPFVLYVGVVLTKDMKPRNDGQIAYMSDGNSDYPTTLIMKGDA